jgi:hypothetical protein
MASGLVTRAICTKIPNRAFLSVTGTNSAQLLNGLITTTVPWPPIGGFYSAFLAASVCLYKCPLVTPNNLLCTGKDAI